MNSKGNRLAHSDQGPAKSGQSYNYVYQDPNVMFLANSSSLMNQPIMFNGHDTSFIYEGNNQTIQQNFKLLTKKSDQSRLRGLKEISSELVNLDESEISMVIPPFVYSYEQLLFSNDKQVRVSANSLLKLIGERYSKGLKSFMTKLMPIWYMYMNDTQIAVSEEATSSYISIIPESSRQTLLKKYSDPIIRMASKYIHISESMLEKRCSGNDSMQECKERLHIIGLNIYISLINKLDTYTELIQQTIYEYFIDSLPTSFASTSIPVLTVSLQFLTTLFEHFKLNDLLPATITLPENIDRLNTVKKSLRSILSIIGTITDTSIQAQMIGTWMNMIIKWPELWSYCNHDECINSIIKKLKTPEFDNSYFISNYELFLQLMHKMEKDTYKGTRFTFYSLFLTTFYMYICNNKDILLTYYTVLLQAFKYMMLYSDSLPASICDFYKHIFIEDKINLYQSIYTSERDLRDITISHLAAEVLILCYNFDVSIYETISEYMIGQLSVCVSKRPSKEEEEILKERESTDFLAVIYMKILSCILISQTIEPPQGLHDSIINKFHLLFSDFLLSPLFLSPNVFHHKRLIQIFNRIDTLSFLPLALQCEIYPCEIDPIKYLKPLITHAFHQIETSNYNTQQDTFIIEPLYSLLSSIFPLFEVTPNIKGSVHTLLVCIQDTVSSLLCDNLYKLQVFAQFLAHKDLYDSCVHYSLPVIVSLNTMITEIFNNNYVLFQPKFSIYMDTITTILKHSYLYIDINIETQSVPCTLLYQLVNPIFENLIKYNTNDIISLFSTIFESFNTMTIRDEPIVIDMKIHMYTNILKYINENKNIKSMDTLLNVLNHYYNDKLYSALSEYVLSINKILSKPEIQENEIQTFIYCLSILDKQTVISISKTFYESKNLYLLLHLSENTKQIVSTVFSIFPSLYLPQSLSLEEQTYIYILTKTYNLEETVTRYPSILTAIETTTYDYIPLFTIFFNIYKDIVQYENIELLISIRSIHITMMTRAASCMTQESMSVYIVSTTMNFISLIQETINNTKTLEYVSLYLYQFTKVIYSLTSISPSVLADIRIDYINTLINLCSTVPLSESSLLFPVVVLYSLYSKHCTITDDESQLLLSLSQFLSVLFDVQDNTFIHYMSKFLLSLLYIRNPPLYTNAFYNHCIPIINRSIPQALYTALKFFIHLQSDSNGLDLSAADINNEDIMNNEYILIFNQLNFSLKELSTFINKKSNCKQLLTNYYDVFNNNIFIQDLMTSSKFYLYIHKVYNIDMVDMIILLFELFIKKNITKVPCLYINIFYFIYWIMNLENSPLSDINTCKYILSSIQTFCTNTDDYSYSHHLYFILLLSKLNQITKNSEEKLAFYDSFDIQQYISTVLPMIVSNLPFVHITAKTKPESPILSLSLLKPIMSPSLFDLTSVSLLSLLQSYPSLVRHWWINIPSTDNKISLTLQYFIEIYLNTPLIISEYNSFKQRINELNINGITISLLSNQIDCTIPFDDTFIHFNINIPTIYPLNHIKMNMNSTNIISKSKFQKWNLQLLNYKDINMSLSTCLYNFFNSIQNSLNGVEPCPICYCVIHPGTNTLPDTKCKQCVGVFHKHCLYKWFVTSGGNTCPLCRQHMILESL